MTELSYAAEQIQELLRCAICLDRFRSPKLLPCQHTFCQSPCLEGLVDRYTRRVRCPQCRVEHRVPFTGTEGFPNNLTIISFLELPQQPVGVTAIRAEAPSAASVPVNATAASQGEQTTSYEEGRLLRSTCMACGQYGATLSRCNHCGGQVCDACKRAHQRELTQEVTRLIQRIRRALPNISEALGSVEYRAGQIRRMCQAVKVEINEQIERYVRELRARQDLLGTEVDSFMLGELRSVRSYEESLEVELASIASFCDTTEMMIFRGDLCRDDNDVDNVKRQCTAHLDSVQRYNDNATTLPLRQLTIDADGVALTNAVSNFGELLVVVENRTGSQAGPSENEQRSRGYLGDSEGLLARAAESALSLIREQPGQSESAGMSRSERNQTVRTGESRSLARDESSLSSRLAGFRNDSSSSPARIEETGLRNENDSAATVRRGQFISPLDRDIDSSLRRGEFGLASRRTDAASSLRRGDSNLSARWGESSFSTNHDQFSNSSAWPELTASSNRESPLTIERNQPDVSVTQELAAGPADNSYSTREAANRGERLLNSPRNELGFLQRRDRFTPSSAAGSQQHSDNQLSRSISPPILERRSLPSSPIMERRDPELTPDDQIITGALTWHPRSEHMPRFGRYDRGTYSRFYGDRLRGQNSDTAMYTGFSRRDLYSLPAIRNQERLSAISFDRDSSEPAEAEASEGAHGRAPQRFSATRFDAHLDDSSEEDTEETSAPGYRFTRLPSTIVSNARNNYKQKGRAWLRFGERGSETSQFVWPRGVAISPTDDSILVSDSSNHRVQIFDNTGLFVKAFGSYGRRNGEFDCIMDVAVNNFGQIAITDRHNHRVQVFDHHGLFQCTFGGEGSSDGQFRNAGGIAWDNMGFIYVCDRENNRVQVFQCNGNFVRKFGRLGRGIGSLDNPYYVAVSSDNHVYVTDCNNHRIQVFSIYGDFLFSFGSQGTNQGQLKYPRGIAIDNQGYIIIADSGNNRIQIFRADGRFYTTFGSWGDQNGQFKGPEGVAVMSSATIVVTDRENHRVQLF